MLAVDIGATHVRLAVTDLAATVLADETVDLDIALGPDAVLGWVIEHGRALVTATGRTPSDLAGVGIGVPGPVEHATGRPTNPPIMPGWDGFDVPRFVLDALGPVAVVVDNDVNIMAIGEHAMRFADVDHLMFVKVATGIGSGIISDGALRRGAQGAAGDLGHIQVPHDVDAVCRCGNVGCLEAVASGPAIAGRLRAAGVDAVTSHDVVDPRPRGLGAGQPPAAGGRTDDRRGAGERGQPAQSERHRRRGDRRPSPATRCSPACARSSTAARCRWPRRNCASCRRPPATSRVSSAPPCWSSTRCWLRPRSIATSADGHSVGSGSGIVGGGLSGFAGTSGSGTIGGGRFGSLTPRDYPIRVG